MLPSEAREGLERAWLELLLERHPGDRLADRRDWRSADAAFDLSSFDEYLLPGPDILEFG
jgi:hypothetical protein